MPAPRSAVMILVQATWEDQHGTLQTARACMENRSPSGACIRVPARIAAGTKLKIQWRWEEFNGVAKYCRTDGQEYLVGVQRIAAVVPRGAAATTTKTIAPPPRKHNHAAASATTANETLQTAQPPTFASPTHAQIKISAVAAEHDKPQTQIPAELPAALKKSENETHTAAPATLAAPPETLAAASAPDTRTSTQQHNTPRHDFDALPRSNADATPPHSKGAGKERKTMRRKWLELTPWGNKEDTPNGSNGHAPANVTAPGPSNGANDKSKRSMEARPAMDKKDAAADDRAANFQAELMCMEDIYRAAGIMNPRRGYSVTKVVEMLHSDHMRGLSKEMKRAAVLMALDAAGVSADEVLHDAKIRQDAIDAYEAEQRKQMGAEWARKAEENVQLQAELESVRAHYMERLKRNLDGVAREKSTFGNWLTLKQQEAQSMLEAVDLCLKPLPAEPVRDSLAEVSLVDASAKPI
jgi:hypothetical protein